jgi:hypothetical protein
VFRVAGRFLVDNLKEGTLSGRLLSITGHGTPSRGFEFNTVVRG